MLTVDGTVRPFGSRSSVIVRSHRSLDRIRLSGKSAWLFFNPPGDIVSPEVVSFPEIFREDSTMKYKRTGDIRKGINQRFIEALKHGAPPWIKPWGDSDCGHRPINAATGHIYSGINVSILWSEAIRSGFETDRWLTLRQANSLGGRVTKGQRGTTVVVYKQLKVRRRPADCNDIDAEETSDFIRLMKGYTVFNVEQCTGIPDRVISAPLPAQWTELSSVTEFVDAAGADIVHGKDSAVYEPNPDRILMPAKAAFEDRAGYYPTLFHEMVHWTGHPSRLNRPGIRNTKQLDPREYAFEEMVAEIGSAYLCADFGIQGELRHDSYVLSWIEVLDSDPKAIFAAAAQAEQAVGFLKEVAQAGN